MRRQPCAPYKADLANFKTWREAHRFDPMPAPPETVGADLAGAGLGYGCLQDVPRRGAWIGQRGGTSHSRATT